MTLRSVLLCAASLLGTASAQEAVVQIPIFNPTFAADTLTCAPGPTCYMNNITGWLCGPGTFTLKLSTAE